MISLYCSECEWPQHNQQARSACWLWVTYVHVKEISLKCLLCEGNLWRNVLGGSASLSMHTTRHVFVKYTSDDRHSFHPIQPQPFHPFNSLWSTTCFLVFRVFLHHYCLKSRLIFDVTPSQLQMSVNNYQFKCVSSKRKYGSWLLWWACLKTIISPSPPKHMWLFAKTTVTNCHSRWGSLFVCSFPSKRLWIKRGRYWVEYRRTNLMTNIGKDTHKLFGFILNERMRWKRMRKMRIRNLWVNCLSASLPACLTSCLPAYFLARKLALLEVRNVSSLFGRFVGCKANAIQLDLKYKTATLWKGWYRQRVSEQASRLSINKHARTLMFSWVELFIYLFVLLIQQIATNDGVNVNVEEAVFLRWKWVIVELH